MAGSILAASAIPVSAQTPEKEAARGVVQSIEDAINARDWAEFASHFTGDGDAILFTSERAVGPDAVQDLMARGWAIEVLRVFPPEAR